MSAGNSIRYGQALPAAGMPSSAPSHDYTSIIGRHAILKPAGENVTLDASLPRGGVITRQLALTDWGSDWLVMTFDVPVRYDGTEMRYCLIRARWLGCPVGSELCPVFVLSDSTGALTKKKEWGSGDFQFISWGMVDLDATLASAP